MSDRSENITKAAAELWESIDPNGDSPYAPGDLRIEAIAEALRAARADALEESRHSSGPSSERASRACRRDPQGMLRRHPQPVGRGDMSETVVELARAAYERRSKALGDTHLRPWELLPARAREQEVERYRTVRADALEEAAHINEELAAAQRAKNNLEAAGWLTIAARKIRESGGAT